MERDTIDSEEMSPEKISERKETNPAVSKIAVNENKSNSQYANSSVMMMTATNLGQDNSDGPIEMVADDFVTSAWTDGRTDGRTDTRTKTRIVLRGYATPPSRHARGGKWNRSSREPRSGVASQNATSSGRLT